MLQGKSIIVTGAARGIGEASAKFFAQQGALLTLADREDCGPVADAIVAAGGTAQAVRCDVSDEDHVKALVAAAVGAYGRLDGAFNNAGIEQQPALITDLSLDEFRRVVEIDMVGVFLCMKYQIPELLKAGGGAIVNTSSVLGVVAIQKNASYTAAKHGVVGLTKSASMEFAGQGIRINALMPGAVATPMFASGDHDPAMAAQLASIKAAHPIGRMAEPVEMGKVAAFLLSDLASYVTGIAMAADGGYTAG